MLTDRASGAPLDGYVVGVGTTWLLLAPVAEGGALNRGWVAVRTRDVTRVRRLDRRSFAGRCTRSTPASPPRPPQHPVDLDSTRALLTSMSWNAPLVAFEQERRRSALRIGVLLHHRRRRSVFLEVTPRARRNPPPLSYARRDITAVAINGDHLEALATVAGAPPSATIRREMAAGATMPAAAPPQRVLQVFFDSGHQRPLWETGHGDYANTPAGYGLSRTASRLMHEWREAWFPVADPDRDEPPTAQELADHRHAAAAAIAQIKQEAPVGVVVDAHRYPAP